MIIAIKSVPYTSGRLVRIVIALLFVFSLHLSLTTSASAGINGQQLQVQYQTTNASCGGMIASRITVTGRNQHGSQATWSTDLARANFCGTAQVTTSGWWWKGPVSVIVTYRNSSGSTATKTCGFNVPTWYGSNTYTVRC